MGAPTPTPSSRSASPSSIQREFANYETFVKDTLPPITARIQHTPVVLRGGDRAAVQYTFIAEPGRLPTSLRLALLANPQPHLLFKLFETFRAQLVDAAPRETFRLSREYDRVLPTHYVLEPASGRGRILDGRSAPAEHGFAGWRAGHPAQLCPA